MRKWHSHENFSWAFLLTRISFFFSWELKAHESLMRNALMRVFFLLFLMTVSCNFPHEILDENVVSEFFCTNNAQAPSLFSNVTSRRTKLMVWNGFWQQCPSSVNMDQQVRRIVRKFNLPVRVVCGQAPNLKQRLARSALLPSGCTIHDKFVEERRQSKRRPSRPREDCISCRAGLKETHCDRQCAVYSLTCTICSKECIGETQRPIRARVQEHFVDTRKRRKDTSWGEHAFSFHKDIACAKERTPIFTAHILAFEENVIRRKAREAIEIRDRWPEINRNGGWQLVQWKFFWSHACSQLTPFVSHMHTLHTVILTSTFTHFTHYHTLQLPRLVFSLHPDPKVVSYRLTEEGHCCQKPFHTINFVRLLVTLEKREGACALFVLYSRKFSSGI